MRTRQEMRLPMKITLTFSFLALVVSAFLAACQPTQPPSESYNQPQIAAGTESEPGLSAQPEPTDTPSTGWLPSPTPDCRSLGGEVISQSLYSEHLEAELHYRVFLPPCYHIHSDAHYPTLYLLHGLGTDEAQWLRLGLIEETDALIAAHQSPELIIILPRESRFQSPPGSPFPRALIEELIPEIDAQYRTLPEKKYRGIGGVSRGASWAVHIGFTHPELFSRVGAHSLPLFAADTGKLNEWMAGSTEVELPFFFIDTGRSDPDRQNAEGFANLLNENHIPHIWYLFTGGHTEDYWAGNLGLYLQWYIQDWQT